MSWADITASDKSKLGFVALFLFSTYLAVSWFSSYDMHENVIMGTFILLLFVATLADLAFYRILGNAAAGRDEALEEVFWIVLKKFPSYIFLGFLSIIIALLSLIAFIIPAFYILPKIIFAPVILLVEDSWNSLKSLNDSWNLTKGNFGYGLILAVATSGVNKFSVNFSLFDYFTEYSNLWVVYVFDSMVFTFLSFCLAYISVDFYSKIKGNL